MVGNNDFFSHPLMRKMRMKNRVKEVTPNGQSIPLMKGLYLILEHLGKPHLVAV